MAEDQTVQAGEGDKKIVHTYPLVKVTKFTRRNKKRPPNRTKASNKLHVI